MGDALMTRPSRWDIPRGSWEDDAFTVSLTSREKLYLLYRDVLRASWSAIAAEMGVTPRTVTYYAERVWRKWQIYQAKEREA